MKPLILAIVQSLVDKPEEIEDIPNAYEWHRLQKRPFVLFLTKKLLGVKNA